MNTFMTMVLNYLLSKMLISVSLVCPPTLTPMSANAGDPGLTLGSKRSPEKEWQPSPVFLPGELHGQRRLAGYSPWSHKELDTTEWLILPFFMPWILSCSFIWNIVLLCFPIFWTFLICFYKTKLNYYQPWSCRHVLVWEYPCVVCVCSGFGGENWIWNNWRQGLFLGNTGAITLVGVSQECG